MYESVRIQNFRCFEDLTVDGLTRVNLIVGQNGVGKTALLEAIVLLDSAIAGESLSRVDRWRSLPVGTGSVREFFEPLFTGFDTNKQIAVEALDGTQCIRRVSMRLVGDEKIIVPIGDSKWRGVDRLEVSLSVVGGGTPFVSEVRLTPVRRDQEAQLEVQPRRPGAPGYSPVMLNMHTLTGAKEDALRLSRLIETRRSGTVIEALRLIRPDLTDLQVLPKGEESWIYADTGGARLVPVGLLGDGVNRLLSMLVAMPEVASGNLLVDEVGAGLHYAVQRDVWRVLAEAARQADCRILATTHSYECMTAAYEAFADHPEDFSMHRLERGPDGTVKSHDFGHESLGTALELGFEVR